MKEKVIYLDYNATTPVDRAVAEAMKPYMEEIFGNPSSIHDFGANAKIAVENARSQVALFLNCLQDEIVFTSGGTESNNFAIKGAAYANLEKGNHLITSAVEHPSVLEVFRHLEGKGFEVSYLPVDENGCIDMTSLENAVTTQTTLISIMHANNETGTIQPIAEIGKIARRSGILFHTDAAQSCGKIPVDVGQLGADLLSVAGHKLYAPKGIGALYIRRGTKLEKLIHGADHEQNLRAGTENVMEIVGLGKAAEIAVSLQLSAVSYPHLSSLRDMLYSGLLKEWPEVKLNGHPTERLPNTLNISFPGIEANRLLAEMKGLAASAGAACHSDRTDISYVLTAMKVPLNYAMGTVRFSVGRMTTEEEIRAATQIVLQAVHRLSAKKHSSSPIRQPGSEIRLTQYTRSLGCACKIRPQVLEEILKKIPLSKDPSVLVDTTTCDDAAVYRISDSTAIVQTVDFIPPVVDDPYDYGAIAAANSLSDIYAMGGKPLFALSLVAFPETLLPREVLYSILEGATDKANEAGISIIGGHSIEDTEPKFGLVVTGSIPPDRIITNSGAKPGDAIILTKPIGTGILTTGIKRGLVDPAAAKEMIDMMSELNRTASEVMLEFPVNACTDVTGFGLLGHLKEMITAAGLGAEIWLDRIPVLKGVWELATANVVPGGTRNNLGYTREIIDADINIPELARIILADAQTSGGLLICVPDGSGPELVKRLISRGIKSATMIGTITGNRCRMHIKRN